MHIFVRSVISEYALRDHNSQLYLPDDNELQQRQKPYW